MATEIASKIADEAMPLHVFERVLVGVDRSPASIEAVRQATVLCNQAGTLTLLSAWTVPPPTVSVVSTSFAHDLDPEVYRDAAARAVALAQAAVASAEDVDMKIVRGTAWGSLIQAAIAAEATLVAVGSHGQGRIRGILIGSTATEVIHKALCSVLVARPAGDGFPRRVVVGIDGSRESAAAFATARRIAARFGSELWPIVAHGGEGVDKAAVAEIVDYHHEDLPDDPVEALVAGSVDADLLIVGSRGLHGIKALGSVSERVAHQAHCSTLIVRRGLPAGGGER
jgi:nucleotide-binding universal stress UspA family protein